MGRGRKRRGSRRLPQIRAQMNADFSWGKLEVAGVMIPQMRGAFAVG